MEANDTSGFVVEYVSVSPHPHGFGKLDDGSPFAFRLIRRDMHVEVYREDVTSDVPDTDDVVARAKGPVTDIDVSDERSVVGLVRDLLQCAESAETGRSPAEGVTVRALLGRIGSVIDAI